MTGMIIQSADRLENVQEYYFSKKLAQLALMRSEGKDVINLGIGSPDMAPEDSVISALYNTAKEKSSHGYMGYRGLQELRDAMAIWYFKTYGVKLDREHEVLPLMGSKEAIMHISMAFLNKGDKVLVPNPGYPAYSAVTELMQAEIMNYDLMRDNWYPDFDLLEKEDLSGVKLMWVNYPNMPTGQPASKDIFEKIISFAKKHSILVINDNPYSLVLNKEKPLSILSVAGAKEVALELNSMSKSHNMAGWRVGMLMGMKAYLDVVLRVKSNMDSGMFKGIQIAAVEALNLDESFHDAINKQYSKRREVVYQIYDLLECSYSKNQEGMFVWAKLPDSVSSAEAFIENILDKTFVFITPGFIFGSNGDRYLRISLCAGVEVFEEALERLKNKL